ncbi:Integrase, catalytic core [Cucumis melo var. makuwa]|uniref:Integrase, catalytic core n=1 Tax=Cucumis melo var. makuwa TaxID=1194695 RepID=A0A5D3DCJ0_CUCMM|nr:Integrase, catalytic core [Cucumis melo var. makuwa]TYK21190.1 Integrase, catalytic core [Cucumis melo var. makuwa]
MTAKVLQNGYFWPTLFQDVRNFIVKCDRYQRTRNMSHRNEMSQRPILEIELFNVWGIDFMGPFPQSTGHIYILLVVDYVSKWVEAISYAKNDVITVNKFLKRNIFTRFGTLKALINDEISHFINHIIAKLLVTEIKKILEKVVNASRKDWAEHLDSALWAYCTLYKTPIGISSYALVFGKACHLPLELEYKALWVCKKLNFNHNATRRARLIQLNEL